MDSSSLTGLSQAYTANLNGKAQAGVKKPRAAKATKPRAKPKAKPTAKSTKQNKSTQQAKSTLKVEVADNEPGFFIDCEEPSAPLSTTTKAVATLPPEPIQETAVTLALNFEKDEEVRVLRKEKCTNLGIASVRRVKDLFEKHAESFRDGAAWIEQCDEIIQLSQIPRILIGVLGYTGSGKSSLINALVEHETIVPCNAMRASTSVVVEIGYNTSEDPRQTFRAEIEFITAQEWDAEFDILADDIKNRPVAEQLSLNGGTDASLGYAKLSAVYPGIPINRIVESSPVGLELERDLSHVLGQSITIQESTALKFSEAINAYIDSSNKGTDADEFAYWPLVRLVKVYIKSDLLKHGLVLVDLPGLGDSNLGRTQVAEKYIQKLRHMWVVADIVRAIDDKVANELMSRSFKRQLLMDGRYHENFVTFVMTKTDQVTTHEVMKSLNLDKSVLKDEVAQETRLSDELAELKEQLSQLKRDRKRKLAEVESGSEALNAVFTTETNLNAKILKVKKSINALNVKMKAVCIQERNKYTQGHLSQDFKTGQGELMDELEISAPEPEGSKSSLNSFCVSAKAYQKLSGRFKRDNSIKGFRNVNDTNIPTLQAFAQQCTLADREHAADKILTEINLFEVTLKSWAESRGKSAQLSDEQRDQLLKEVNKHYEVVKKATDRAKLNVMANVRRTVKAHVIGNLGTIVNAGTEDALKLSTELANKDIAWASWRAICKRSGDKYKTGKKVEYHFNDAFSEPFIEPLSRPWKLAFHVRLPAQHELFANAIINALREFQKSLRGSVSRVCGRYDLAHNILQQVPILEDQIRGKVHEALEVGQNHAKEAHRTVAVSVKAHMLTYYDAAFGDSGSGVGKRMKKNLVIFTKKHGKSMFESTSKTLVTELDKIGKVLSSGLGTAAKISQMKLKRDIVRVINLGGVHESSLGSTATAELRRLVLKELLVMDETWAKELEDPTVDLRARNPFANVVHTEEDEDEKYIDGEGQSDAEVSEDDGSASESSSEEDNDNSDDSDYDH